MLCETEQQLETLQSRTRNNLPSQAVKLERVYGWHRHGKVKGTVNASFNRVQNERKIVP